MDDDCEADFDAMVRFQAMQWAENIADRLGQPWDTQQTIANAAQIAHFVTSGEAIAFECAEALRKTIRGQ